MTTLWRRSRRQTNESKRKENEAFYEEKNKCGPTVHFRRKAKKLRFVLNISQRKRIIKEKAVERDEERKHSNDLKSEKARRHMAMD